MNPEHISAILERYFNNIHFRNILLICEKLKKNIEMSKNNLPFPVYCALCLRIETILLCTGQLLTFDKDLLNEIIFKQLIEIDKILTRLIKND